MQTTVVSCREIKPDVYGLWVCEGFKHDFDFPEEWDGEERILLTGIYISEVVGVGLGLFAYQFVYYNLRIVVTNEALIFDDDPNVLAKFTVPVVIDKAVGTSEFAFVFAEKKMNDLTITFQWCTIQDCVDANRYWLNSAQHSHGPFTIPSILSQGSSIYLQIWAIDRETDTCSVQPADQIELPENMIWTNVSPTIIRIDGPSESCTIDYQTSGFKYVSYHYFFVSVVTI